MLRHALLASTVLLSACATNAADPLPVALPVAEAAPAAPAAPAAHNAELATFFTAYDKAELELSPLSKSYRAIKDEDYGALDQYTDAASLANRDLDQRTAEALSHASIAPR